MVTHYPAILVVKKGDKEDHGYVSGKYLKQRYVCVCDIYMW